MPENHIPERDEYTFLVDVISRIQEPRVLKTFGDVMTAPGYPDTNNPRHVLAFACTLQLEDTDTMIVMRLLLYYLLSRKARDFHPTMFATPEPNFHDSVVFKPQIQLIFLEDRIDAVNANRRPLQAQISYRLMNVTPESLTPENVDTIAQRIWDLFVLPSPFKFMKGEIIGNYRDKTNGYELRILADTETTLRSVIGQVLAINELELDDQFFSISKSSRTFPTPEETISILGEDYEKPVQRPSAWVHFVRAELKLLGMRTSKLLVCRADLLDSRCSRINSSIQNRTNNRTTNSRLTVIMIKICLDAGHGGVESGAVYSGYQEKTINLAITTLLEVELKKLGFLVKMTRNSDTFIALSQRAYISNQFKADYFISVHCNAFGNPVPHGFETYYYNSGKALAESILRGIASDRITSVRYSKQANFSVLLHTLCPAVLLECGYMSNPADIAQLVTTAHQKLLAKSIAMSVFKYINLNHY
jgi:N-acetylmuramoyl-L-alanine amidase